MEWSDGSLQLLIGNEVLDISKQDAKDEQAHLFMRHGKVTLHKEKCNSQCRSFSFGNVNM